MKSRTTRKFWRLFDALPPEVQEHARRAYAQFAADPSHPGLNFKRVGKREPWYSARIGLEYRALGLLKDDTITWAWIGHHDEYDRII
jgi:hypothetical protein